MHSCPHIVDRLQCSSLDCAFYEALNDTRRRKLVVLEGHLPVGRYEGVGLAEDLSRLLLGDDEL